MDWNQKEITSNLYDPTPIAVRSSQIINESSTSGGVTGGVPGAASNLPTPVPTTTGAAGSTYQRSEETINYEISQVQSHEVVAPGKVRRLSVSVMVDGITDPAQLDVITMAATAAAGIDTTRGDQISVQSFDFDTTALDALAAELAAQQQMELYMQIALAVGSGIVVLTLLFIALRMINNLRNASKDTWITVMKPVSEMSALPGSPASTPLPQPASPAALPAAAAKPASTPASAQIPPAPEPEDVIVQITPKAQSQTALEDEQRARVISRLAEENPASVAEIIQIWLNEGKKS